MIVPDGGKVWIVTNHERMDLYSSRKKHDAIDWAIINQPKSS
jgi:hypothetical protein